MLQSNHILIIHYHFKKGGVTDVISEAIKTFDAYNITAQITLACGDTSEQSNEIITSIGTLKNISLKSKCLTALGYSESFTKTDHDEVSYTHNYSVLEHFFTTYTARNTLWWVHNPHIGKNPFFTKVLMEHLERTEQPCILHMHDFPEQARFSNLEALQKIIPLSSCYKAVTSTQYVVINSVDAHILRNSGMCVYYIPNIVIQNTSEHVHKKPCDAHVLLQSIDSQYAHTSKNALLFTYPVRCIRRKNVLEAALITKLYECYARIPCNYNITLPGESKQEKHYSDMVQSLFQERTIHGFFASGKDPRNTVSLAEMCSASNLILSSSIQEGFGFSYVKSALWGCPLLARFIEVAKDSAALLKFWNVYWYNEIAIPLTLLSSKECLYLRNVYEEKIREVCAFACYTSQHAHILREELAVMMSAASIDFSFLSVPIQMRFLRDFDEHSDDLLKANKKLMKKTHILVQSKHNITDEKIQYTRDSIMRRFGKHAFVKAFTDAVNAVKNSKAMHDPHAVAHATLDAHAHLLSLRTAISLDKV